MNLETLLEKIFRLTPAQKNSLNSIGIKTIEDLLRYFPVRYSELGALKSIENLIAGEEVVVFGKIKAIKVGKTFRSKIAITSATVEDSTGRIKVIWFNQPYISKMFFDNTLVRIEGRVSNGKNGFYFSNPKIEKVHKIPTGTSESLFSEETAHHLHPVYRETKHISSLWIYHHLQKIFTNVIKSGPDNKNFLDTLIDPIPENILKKYNLPSLKTSLIWIHTPQKKTDAEIARKRFAFEEIFLIQIDRQKEKYLAEKEKTFKIETSKENLDKFIKDFPFPVTKAQTRAIEQIIKDLGSDKPMSRLLEGDVGSGKTAVAAVASFAAIKTNQKENKFQSLQVAYMAPTEILAEQHFESFIEYFKKYKIKIGLITGSSAKKFPSKLASKKSTKIYKSQLLKWVENGEISILIGTHALIQKQVKFKNLGLIIIDEQHKFGVKQRKNLRRKQDFVPHLLSMTATPIPRTLALTIFGDLDLSVLDELPSGRKIPETKIVLPHERDQVYEKIRAELKNGRQAYVICPRIKEPDPNKEKAINAKSVIEEAERLQKQVFPDFKIGVITGKMTPAEKEKVMRDFAGKNEDASSNKNKIDILVATSVVEVGVNVPNATTIIIENAERFGLAQLHQLRGRVLRSHYQPYCFVFAENQSDKTIKRLKSFVEAKNGFELAEADLKQRGTGDLSGNKQWGLSDLAMEALKNIKMVELAREEAKKIIEMDSDLKKYPLLKKRIETRPSIHME